MVWGWRVIWPLRAAESFRRQKFILIEKKNYFPRSVNVRTISQVKVNSANNCVFLKFLVAVKNDVVITHHILQQLQLCHWLCLDECVKDI
jgi:hypothetical protein